MTELMEETTGKVIGMTKLLGKARGRMEPTVVVSCAGRTKAESTWLIATLTVWGERMTRLREVATATPLEFLTEMRTFEQLESGMTMEAAPVSIATMMEI